MNINWPVPPVLKSVKPIMTGLSRSASADSVRIVTPYSKMAITFAHPGIACLDSRKPAGRAVVYRSGSQAPHWNPLRDVSVVLQKKPSVDPENHVRNMLSTAIPVPMRKVRLPVTASGSRVRLSGMVFLLDGLSLLFGFRSGVRGFLSLSEVFLEMFPEFPVQLLFVLHPGHLILPYLIQNLHALRFGPLQPGVGRNGLSVFGGVPDQDIRV